MHLVMCIKLLYTMIFRYKQYFTLSTYCKCKFFDSLVFNIRYQLVLQISIKYVQLIIMIKIFKFTDTWTQMFSRLDSSAYEVLLNPNFSCHIPGSEFTFSNCTLSFCTFPIAQFSLESCGYSPFSLRLRFGDL